MLFIQGPIETLPASGSESVAPGVCVSMSERPRWTPFLASARSWSTAMEVSLAMR